MSENTRLEEFCSVVEKTAQVVDVPFSREKVWPVLAAYGDAYGDVIRRSVVSFRVQNGARGAGDLDCRFTMLPKEIDPYAVAVKAGLIEETGHPVGSLLKEVHRELPIDSCGVDFGVLAGFTKTWSFPPAEDLHTVSQLVELPSIPQSVAENAAFFERYGLADIVSTVGIDYAKRTVNLYFGGGSGARVPRECFAPQGVRAILREIGMPEPSEELLKFCEQSFVMYATLRWDSPKIERMTYSVMTPDPLGLPVRVDPVIERLVKNAPYSTEGRNFVYGVTATPKGEYHKIQSYYQWQTQVEDHLVSDAG